MFSETTIYIQQHQLFTSKLRKMASKILAPPAYFKWKWISDGSIMVEGQMKFIKENDCYQSAMRCQPSYDTGDGPDSPGARLIVTAYDHQDKAVPFEEVRGAFGLCGNVRIQVLVYDEQPCIDIRRWSRGYPTRKGISISPQDWVSLMASKNNLAVLIKDVKEGRQVDERLHINGSVFATVSSPSWIINIREWYEKGGSEKPSWKGVRLRFSEWNQLLRLREDVNECMQEIRGVQLSDSHQMKCS